MEKVKATKFDIMKIDGRRNYTIEVNDKYSLTLTGNGLKRHYEEGLIDFQNIKSIYTGFYDEYLYIHEKEIPKINEAVEFFNSHEKFIDSLYEKKE